MPNDRILNIISQKKITFSEDVKNELVGTQTDSLDVMQLIKRGDIDFSKSQVKNDPCRNYWIEGSVEQKDLVITVELCDSTAVVKTLTRKAVVKK